MLSTTLTRLGPVESSQQSDYDPPEAVRRLPSWLLGQASRRAQGVVARALAPERAGRQHFTMLASLAERGPASQADLGRRLWLDRSDTHAIVSALEAAGLVERTVDPADQRRKVVNITAAGRRARRQLEGRIQAAQEDILAPLTAHERVQLLELLARLGRD